MILPGATVGVLGGGQLGRMFVLRARAMGYRTAVLDPDPVSPAGTAADLHLRAAYTDPAALDRLASSVTPSPRNSRMSRRRRWSVSRGSCRVRPPVSAVAVTQDRISEKQFLERSGFPTAPFRPVRNERELQAAVREVALPALLKTSRLGYDGKGQAPVDRPEDAPPAFRALGSVPCVLERRLALETEVSVVLARGDDGAVAAFPVGENRHRNGILETTVVPAQVGRDTLDAARSIACRVATALEYVGVLGVEMFVADGGRIYVNELAPRPHNSGHYTLDACSVDQFEQQLRALCALPLAEPRLLSPVAMINLLGDLWSSGEPRWVEVFRRPGVKLHLYGKAEPRPGRKMGHLNCLADDPARALALAVDTRDALVASTTHLE